MRPLVLTLGLLFFGSITTYADPTPTASIVVTSDGDLSAHQSKFAWTACLLKKDKEGKYLMGQVSPSFASSNCVFPQAVGTKASGLAAGEYLIFFSNTFEIVTLADGEQKIVKLAKLPVPKIGDFFKFDVFRDLTNVKEQEKERTWKLLTETFLSPGFSYRPDPNGPIYVRHILEFCKQRKVPGAFKYACRGINSRTLESVFDFDQKANLTVFDWDQPNQDFQSLGREAVVTDAIVSDHDEIAVLPGIYGITRTSSSGYDFDQYGQTSE